MSTPPATSSPVVSDRVPARVAELIELEETNATDFVNALAEAITTEDQVSRLAFRHPDLVARSHAATEMLLQRSQRTVMRSDRTAHQRELTRRFQYKVGYERKLMEDIIVGLRAQAGRLPNSPNPRRRAEQRLVDENLAGPVPRGRIRELIEEEKAIDAERKRVARSLRKDRRRGRTSPGRPTATS